MQPNSNDTTIFPSVQPPAATPSPQKTLRLSKHIHNLSKPIVCHNANLTIHLLALEEKFISDMMNINAVLDPATGDLLELRQLLKTPKAKLWIDGSFNKLSRLTQGSKKRTIEGTNTIHSISLNQKHTNKKQPMLELLSATDHKKKTHIYLGSLFEVKKSTMQVKPSGQMLKLSQQIPLCNSFISTNIINS